MSLLAGSLCYKRPSPVHRTSDRITVKASPPPARCRMKGLLGGVREEVAQRQACLPFSGERPWLHPEWRGWGQLVNRQLKARSPGLLGEGDQAQQERMSSHQQLSSLVSGRMEAKALDRDPFLITLIPKISEPKMTRLEVIPDQIHFLSLGKLIRAWGVERSSVSLRLRQSRWPTKLCITSSYQLPPLPVNTDQQAPLSLARPHFCLPEAFFLQHSQTRLMTPT